MNTRVVATANTDRTRRPLHRAPATAAIAGTIPNGAKPTIAIASGWTGDWVRSTSSAATTTRSNQLDTAARRPSSREAFDWPSEASGHCWVRKSGDLSFSGRRQAAAATGYEVGCDRQPRRKIALCLTCDHDLLAVSRAPYSPVATSVTNPRVLERESPVVEWDSWTRAARQDAREGRPS